MCIAPVILARVFGKELAPRLTIGNDPATAAAMQDMGAQHVDCIAAETVVDRDNKMVSTPAYMLAGNIGEVFDGALGFAEKLLSLA
jgi:enhancing lycopene biosynthesis protein 2